MRVCSSLLFLLIAVLTGRHHLISALPPVSEDDERYINEECCGYDENYDPDERDARPP
jgi:hypothetical protein